MKVQRAIGVFLALLALLSAGSLIYTGTAYVGAMRSLRDLGVRLARVGLLEGDKPSLLVSYRFDNRSAEPLALEALSFRLYVNGEFLGTSFTALDGQALPAVEEVTLDFTLPLESFFAERLERATQAGIPSWSTQTMLRVRPRQGDQAVEWNLKLQWPGS